MQGRHPTDRQNTPPEPGGARILDITSRLPRREPPVEIVPPRPRIPREVIKLAVVALAATLLGMLAGVYAGSRWEHGTGRRAALELMIGLEQPSALYVNWPAQENRPLRLVGLSDARQIVRAAPPLSPERERLGELWLLEASTERHDPQALRALATYHLKQGADSPYLLLARSELETYLAVHGPSAGVLNDLAVVLALRNQPADAMQRLEQALASQPRDPVLLFNAAQIARAMGQLKQENTFLLKYLQQDQGSRWRADMERRFHFFAADFNVGFSPRGTAVRPVDPAAGKNSSPAAR